MNSRFNRRDFLALSGTLASSAGLLGGRAIAAETEVKRPHCHRFRYALNGATIRGRKLSPDEQLKTAAAAGYEGYEFWISDLTKFQESGGSLKDLRKLSGDLGIKIINGIGFAAWVAEDDQQRAKGTEQMKKEMDLLAQVGSSHVAAPPAGANRAGSTLNLDRAAERYRALVEFGRGIGVIPQLEIWGASANMGKLQEAIYVAAKAAVPEACVLADVFHMYKGGSDPAVLRLLGRNAVSCFHMNDYAANPPRETIRDSDRIWPGDGIAPLKTILQALADNHCDVFLSLELFNAEYDKLPPAEAAKTGIAKMKAVVAAAGLE